MVRLRIDAVKTLLEDYVGFLLSDIIVMFLTSLVNFISIDRKCSVIDMRNNYNHLLQKHKTARYCKFA
jgi:hypothetical protein